MKKKKDNKIKLDLDLDSKFSAKKILKERLSFLHDLNLFDCNNIKEITLIKKKTYGVLIDLNKNLSMEMVFYLQLLLGSDYKKEACSLVNHYKFNMEYSNRLFSIKKYPNGDILESKDFKITKEIKEYVFSKDRKKQWF